MAAIIAPLCVRYTVTGHAAGNVTWANVWDFRITPNEGTTRAEACEQHASVLSGAYGGLLGPYWHDEAGTDTVSWVDLDSEEGSTGSILSNFGGSDTADPAPANTAVLVHKQAPGGGRATRNGRCYFAGLTDPVFASRAIDGPFSAAFQGDLDGFLDDISEINGGTDFPNYSAFAVVVHTRNDGTEEAPNIVYAGNSIINRLSIDPIAATQRRRLRRS